MRLILHYTNTQISIRKYAVNLVKRVVDSNLQLKVVGYEEKVGNTFGIELDGFIR